MMLIPSIMMAVLLLGLLYIPAALFPTPAVWLLTKLRIVKGVLLKDFDGEVRYNIARRDPFDGTMYASVYPFTGVGHVILNPDGTTGGNSIYIHNWKYL
jgi:hypothetical protein